MTFPVEVRLSAQIEAEDAIEFYEGRRKGLGAELRSAIEMTIEGICSHPHSGREFIPGVRRVLVPKFKHRVFYVVESDRIVVIGIYHPAQLDSDLPDRV